MAKILHISKYYYPYYGGIEDIAQTIVEQLKPYHTQKVICFNDKNVATTDIVDGVEVVRVATIGTLFSQPIPRNYTSTLKKILDEFRPDYIHLHLPNPVVTLSLLNLGWGSAKLYLHWHADILGQKFLYFFYKPYEKRLLLRADKVIATSRIYMEHSEVIKNFSYKSVVVPNVVKESKFALCDNDRDEIEKIRQRFGGKKILFFVGRHVAYKGIEYIIDCDKLVAEDCVFVVAGGGPLTSKLKAKTLGSNRIHFVGRLSDRELNLYLRASYLLLFPSLNRSEAFGIALAEALYCGLPAVSFDIEGSGVQWVNCNDYSGIVVENSNTEAFAKAIDKLLKDTEERDHMSLNAHKWVAEQFVADKAFGELYTIYNLPPKPTADRVNASIVLYKNDFEKVKVLVQTLRKSPIVNKIYLVDNSPVIDKRYGELEATYIFNDKNIGYGRGHNIAMRQTLTDRDAAYHIVMNADISFDPSIINNMVEYMDEHPDVGMLMPKVFYPNNKIQYLCRLLPTPLDLFGRRFLPKKVMKKRIYRLEMRYTDYNKIIEVPQLSGSFMLINTAILEKSGVFDERYFMYLEDVDLTRRVSKYAKTIFYPAVHIVHEHHRGSYSSIHLLFRHISSAIKYFCKWGFFSDPDRNAINSITLKNTLQ